MVMKVGDPISAMACQISGVPQGSILGSLLYLRQVITMSRVTTRSEVFQYLDDAVIVTAHKDLAVAQNVFQEDLDRMQK